MSLSDKIPEAAGFSAIGWIVTGALGGCAWVVRVLLTNQREIALLKQGADRDREERRAITEKIDKLIDKLL